MTWDWCNNPQDESIEEFAQETMKRAAERCVCCYPFASYQELYPLINRSFTFVSPATTKRTELPLWTPFSGRFEYIFQPPDKHNISVQHCFCCVFQPPTRTLRMSTRYCAIHPSIYHSPTITALITATVLPNHNKYSWWEYQEKSSSHWRVNAGAHAEMMTDPDNFHCASDGARRESKWN